MNFIYGPRYDTDLEENLTQIYRNETFPKIDNAKPNSILIGGKGLINCSTVSFKKKIIKIIKGMQVGA